MKGHGLLPKGFPFDREEENDSGREVVSQRWTGGQLM